MVFIGFLFLFVALAELVGAWLFKKDTLSVYLSLQDAVVVVGVALRAARRVHHP